MKKKNNSSSIEEEKISALWFIVAGIMHLIHCPSWIFWLIVAKATLDYVMAIKLAIEENTNEDS